MKTLISMALLALLFAAVPASAQMDWSSVGSTGTVDPAAAAIYGYTGPTINFAPGSIGTIVARYQVTNTFGSATSPIAPWNTLRAAIDDNSVNASVRVRLVEVDRCSRVERTLCALGSVDVAGTQCPTCVFAAPIDFLNHSYYVEVTLFRNAVVPFPGVHIVSLF
jgi:hypothetical protein